MSKTPRRNRYDVSGNVEAQFFDATETVLVNKRGITELAALQRLEEIGLVTAYGSMFKDVRTDTPMTCELLRHIHLRIFGDIYDWAGRWRTLNISKPGAVWPAAQFLETAMDGFERDVLREHPASKLGEDTAFCRAVGEIQSEFLAIHPFREGNARTIKLCTDLLAGQTRRPPLVYDQSDEGAQRYILAASAALLKKDYEPMIAIIATALQAAEQPRQSPAIASEAVAASHPETGEGPQ